MEILTDGRLKVLNTAHDCRRFCFAQVLQIGRLGIWGDFDLYELHGGVSDL